MRIFVIGSHGYIARHLALQLSKVMDVGLVSSREVAGMIKLNLVTPEAFSYHQVNTNDVIVFAAAISSPDICRQQRDFAYSVNVVGTSYFIERCFRRGARVIFFSSDTVYGAGDEQRDEESVINPAGEYAVMKSEVEARFSEEPNFMALRLSYVFSRDDKYTSYLTSCAKFDQVASVFHPMCRRVVYLKDVLDIIELLCRSWNSVSGRVLNICGPDLISRLDLAQMYRDLVDSRLRYETAVPPPGFFSARPQIIDMSSRRFEAALGRKLYNIRDAMMNEFSS